MVVPCGPEILSPTPSPAADGGPATLNGLQAYRRLGVVVVVVVAVVVMVVNSDDDDNEMSFCFLTPGHVESVAVQWHSSCSPSQYLAA